MKVLLLSDIHSEFHRDRLKGFVGNLDKTGVRVVILAGDIGNAATFAQTVAYICEHFVDTDVLYCTGNHEFYGSDLRADVLAQIEILTSTYPNLSFLDNNIKVIEGQRFLGTPLWFRATSETQLLKKHWSDFHASLDFDKWFAQENQKAITFLHDNLQEGDFVFSHYLPSNYCVADKWKSSQFNCFFVCELTSLIKERKPKMYAFGHTHERSDFMLGDTRMIANPLGYPHEEPNTYVPLYIEV